MRTANKLLIAGGLGIGTMVGLQQLGEHVGQDRAEQVVESYDACLQHLGNTAVKTEHLPAPCDEFGRSRFDKTTTVAYNATTNHKESKTIYTLPALDNFVTQNSTYLKNQISEHDAWQSDWLNISYVGGAAISIMAFGVASDGGSQGTRRKPKPEQSSQQRFVNGN